MIESRVQPEVVVMVAVEARSAATVSTVPVLAVGCRSWLAELPGWAMPGRMVARVVALILALAPPGGWTFAAGVQPPFAIRTPPRQPRFDPPKVARAR
jgi:hypothetical protein